MKSQAEASDACSVHMVKLFQDERRQPCEIAETEVKAFLCSERGMEVMDVGTADASNWGAQVCVVSAQGPGLRFCTFNATKIKTTAWNQSSHDKLVLGILDCDCAM